MTKRTPALILAAATLILTLTGCVEPPVDIPAGPTSPVTAVSEPEPTPAADSTETVSEVVTGSDETTCDTVRESIIRFNSTDNSAISSEGRANNLTQLSDTLNNSAKFTDPARDNDLSNLKSAVANYYSVTLNAQTVAPSVVNNNTENAQLYYQDASTQMLLSCN